MNVFIVLLDIVLALVAVYLFFPALFAVGSSAPTVLAALAAVGIMIALYGDREFPD